MKYYFIITFLLITALYNTNAQMQKGTALDKIIAIVGKEIITQSDVEGHIALLQQQDPNIDGNNPEIKKRVLEALINDKLLIFKAEEDSVTATDEEITNRWDMHVANLVRHFGSEKRIEDVYGMSLARLKEEYRNDIRNQILIEKLKSQKFGDVKVTQKEKEDFFQMYKDSLPEFPEQVEIFHIVCNIKAAGNVEKEIYELAKRVRDSIMNGGSFAEYAKVYSKDLGTASSGGELGWFEKGKLIPEFEKEAVALQSGQISMPVKTPFGFHLIQTLDKRKDSLLTRHILFKIGQSTDEIDKTKAFLSDLKAKAEKGEKFEDLARKYSDEKETQGFGGYVGKFPLNQIPATIKDIVEKLPEGGISEPYPYSAEPKASFHIIYKKRILQKHKANLIDDNIEIEKLTVNFKQNRLYTEWMQELRKVMYWEIKEP